jgi:hypothetical protein
MTYDENEKGALETQGRQGQGKSASPQALADHAFAIVLF